jgi:hypothetical protein
VNVLESAAFTFAAVVLLRGETESVLTGMFSHLLLGSIAALLAGLTCWEVVADFRRTKK